MMNWIIGDIHGEASRFESLLTQINRINSDVTIWCVGDYCDRGPDSKTVVDLILQSTNIKCIRGNHDDIFHYILTGKHSKNHDYFDRIAALRDFLCHGIISTLTSYGLTIDDIHEYQTNGHMIDNLKEYIPESHIKFYENLPVLIESEDFFVSHGALPLDCPIEQVNDVEIYRKAALWGRFTMDMINSEKEWPKHGYFGHTPTHTYKAKGPIFGPKITLIDTGATYQRDLTAICHETQQILTA